MTEKLPLTSTEINKRLSDAAIMIDFSDTRTAYEVACDFGLLHAGEMCIERATEAPTEV